MMILPYRTQLLAIDRFFIIGLILYLFGITSNVFGGSVIQATSICNEIFSKFTRVPSQTLQPGQSLSYNIRNINEPGLRLENLYLDLGENPSSAKIAEVARDLGNEKLYATRIQNYLRKHSGTKIPIAAIFGGFIKKYTNTTPTVCGPNCFNAVTRWKSQGFFLRNSFTPDKDFNDFIASNYRKINEGMSLKLGDVFVIRMEYPLRSETIHAGVYIGDDYIWHKPSSDRSPYTFERFSQLLNYYENVNTRESLLPGKLVVEFYRENLNP